MLVRKAKSKSAINIHQKILLACLLVIFTNLSARPAPNLFDTEYKIAANYVPVLPLRGLADAEVYRHKKSFTIDRRFYEKDASGKYSEAYEKVYLNCKVDGIGIIGREINCDGTLNELKLKYQNIMKFSLPKRAHMEIHSTLDGEAFIDLNIYSDGDQMTNNVKGLFFKKLVSYQTCWRDTKGTLAGINYQLHTVGVKESIGSFTVSTKGKIGNSVITGSGKIICPNNYEFIEYYGPVMVKTILTVL